MIVSFLRLIDSTIIPLLFLSAITIRRPLTRVSRALDIFLFFFFLFFLSFFPPPPPSFFSACFFFSTSLIHDTFVGHVTWPKLRFIYSKCMGRRSKKVNLILRMHVHLFRGIINRVVIFFSLSLCKFLELSNVFEKKIVEKLFSKEFFDK